MLLSIAWLPSYNIESLAWQGKQYLYKFKDPQNQGNAGMYSDISQFTGTRHKLFTQICTLFEILYLVLILNYSYLFISNHYAGFGICQKF